MVETSRRFPEFSNVLGTKPFLRAGVRGLGPTATALEVHADKKLLSLGFGWARTTSSRMGLVGVGWVGVAKLAESGPMMFTGGEQLKQATVSEPLETPIPASVV